MRTCRAVWLTLTGAAFLLGLGGTFLTPVPGLILAVGLALAVLGGLLATVFADDLADVRHPVLAGAVLATAPALLPGLSRVLGGAALAAAAGLVLSSPWVVVRVERRLRPWLGPVRTLRAGMAAPDDALRRQWAESTRQLDEATSVADRLIVVHARQQILDDVAARSGGPLPPFVWEPRPAKGRHHPSDEPHRPK